MISEYFKNSIFLLFSSIELISMPCCSVESFTGVTFGAPTPAMPTPAMPVIDPGLPGGRGGTEALTYLSLLFMFAEKTEMFRCCSVDVLFFLLKVDFQWKKTCHIVAPCCTYTNLFLFILYCFINSFSVYKSFVAYRFCFCNKSSKQRRFAHILPYYIVNPCTPSHFPRPVFISSIILKRNTFWFYLSCCSPFSRLIHLHLGKPCNQMILFCLTL